MISRISQDLSWAFLLVLQIKSSLSAAENKQEQLQELQIALKSYHEATEERLDAHVSTLLDAVHAAHCELNESVTHRTWQSHMRVRAVQYENLCMRRTLLYIILHFTYYLAQ